MTKRVFEDYKESIPKVREKTGAPTLECVKALYECDGDIEKAVAWVIAHPGHMYYLR